MTNSIEQVIRTMAGQVERLDERSETATKHLASIDGKLSQQNGRIDDLESWRDKFIGGLKGISKLLGITSLVLGAIYTIAKLTGWA